VTNARKISGENFGLSASQRSEVAELAQLIVKIVAIGICLPDFCDAHTMQYRLNCAYLAIRRHRYDRRSRSQ